MGKFTILIVIFGLLIFFLLLVIFLVNNLLLKRKNVEFQFASVIKYVQERVELLDRITIFIKENIKNEDKYLSNINKTNLVLKTIVDSDKENLIEIKKSKQLLQKFISLIDIYPNLEKNDHYNTLVEEAKTNEERIIYAIESYDREAKIYNELKQTKVNSIISKLFKIKDYEYYNK